MGNIERVAGRYSAASYAHMAGHGGGLGAPVDDEIMAFRLAGNGGIDCSDKRPSSSLARKGARKSAASSCPRHM